MKIIVCISFGRKNPNFGSYCYCAIMVLNLINFDRVGVLIKDLQIILVSRGRGDVCVGLVFLDWLKDVLIQSS